MSLGNHNHSNVDRGLSPRDLMGKSEFGVRINLFCRLSGLDIRGRLFLVRSLRGGGQSQVMVGITVYDYLGLRNGWNLSKEEQVEVKMEIDPV